MDNCNRHALHRRGPDLRLRRSVYVDSHADCNARDSVAHPCGCGHCRFYPNRYASAHGQSHTWADAYFHSYANACPNAYPHRYT